MKWCDVWLVCDGVVIDECGDVEYVVQQCFGQYVVWCVGCDDVVMCEYMELVVICGCEIEVMNCCECCDVEVVYVCEQFELMMQVEMVGWFVE